MRTQWVKITTDCHDSGEGCIGNTVVSGWFPIEVASVLFTAQKCTNELLAQPLWDYAKKVPFSKWDLRSDWYIAAVLSPGVAPPKMGWVESASTWPSQDADGP